MIFDPNFSAISPLESPSQTKVMTFCAPGGRDVCFTFSNCLVARQLRLSGRDRIKELAKVLAETESEASVKAEATT
jgi:hypothetical protein